MSDFPDLSGAKAIGFDTETRDPDLTTLGPGHFRDRSVNYIVGVSLATPDGWKKYYPVRHPEGHNYEEASVFKYLGEQLGRDRQPKIGTNVGYDILHLENDNVVVRGKLLDIQIAEPLIDENSRNYSLGALAEKYLGLQKSDTELNNYCATKFGGRATRRAQAKNYWRVPSHVMTKYAEDDAWLPIQIYREQREILKAEKLGEIFDLETRLIPALIAMRRAGVKVDLDRATEFIDELQAEFDTKLLMLRTSCGLPVDIWNAAHIQAVFDKNEWPYPLTPKTRKPSFTATFLETLEETNPFVRVLMELRRIDKVVGTFMQGGIMGHQVDGILHGNYWQLPTDENGAVSGRLSASNPNMQNFPSRTALGKRIRELFVPYPEEDWYKFDYSQIEPRLTMHQALLLYPTDPQLLELEEVYTNDPSTDCYNAMMEHMSGVSRFQTKTLYLGMTYSMGRAKLAASLGVDAKEAERVFNAFHHGAGYISRLSKAVVAKASKKGFIRSLMGRRHRFPLFEPAGWSEEKHAALSEKDALQTYGDGIRRAFTYKGLNRLIQGGAATIMKKAIVDCYESGVWDVTEPPLVTVHDELDHSIPRTPEGDEAAKEIRHMMENAVDLRFPLHVDVETGPNWGQVK